MKLITGIIVVISLVVTTVMFLSSGSFVIKSKHQSTERTTNVNLYANGTYGISFAYPAYFLLAEGERGTQGHSRYTITLIHKDDVALPVGGEGPPSITVEVYPRTLKTLEDWILSTPESNVFLGDKALQKTTVSERDARTYRRSGLYEGISTTFLLEESVVVLSVTYLSPDDAIVSDYHTLLQGFTVSR